MVDGLNRNQIAAARQLSLAAYLLGSDRQWKDESQIRNRIPFYKDLMDSLLEKAGPDTAHASFGRQLKRDVEGLAGAGIVVNETQEDHRTSGGERLYRLTEQGYSPGNLNLNDAERGVLVKALVTFGSGFPYSVPLHLALYSLIDKLQPDDAEGVPIEIPYDDKLAQALAKLDVALSQRRAVRFEYYSISSDETSHREVEPYALSIINGAWYLTGRERPRDEVRQFRLSRLQGRVTFHKNSSNNDYTIPALDPKIYGPRAPWQLEEATELARIRIAPGQGEVLDRLYPGAGTVKTHDGDTVYETHYAGERQLIGTILSLGEGVCVLSPGSLVERTTDCLRSLAESHRPGAVDPAPAHYATAVSGRSGKRHTPARGEGVSPVRPELELALARYVARMEIGFGPKSAQNIPLETIAEEFDVSVEQARSALEAVAEIADSTPIIMGFEIEDGKVVKYIKSGFDRDFNRSFRLSPLQGRAAMLALDQISEAVDPDLLASVQDKVRSAAGGGFDEVSTGGREEDEPFVKDIQEARSTRQVLRIWYPSGGRVKERDVEPALMVSAHGSWYLSAYCRDADDTRLFRLDRILQTELLDEYVDDRPGVEPPDSPEDVNPREFASGRATVRFSAEVARWMEDKSSLEFAGRYQDGSEEYVLYYSGISWAVGRIMLYRGEAVAIEPEELRGGVLSSSLHLLQSHAEDGSARLRDPGAGGGEEVKDE